MVSLFDRIVVVDWSANSTPKRGRDSIWVADVATSSGDMRTTNSPTRHEAAELLERVMCVAEERVLVGVDFSLGFPRGTAAAFGLAGPAWTAIWAALAARVSDDSRNRNNRFEVASDLNGIAGPGPGPFWGCPPSKATVHLTPTKVPSDPLPRWRSVETRLRSGGKRPFSSWQLTGAGAVGSQSLLGIAILERLLTEVRRARRSVDVWPFTTGFSIPTADVVLVEVWPTLADLGDALHDAADSRVRDRVQVETLARQLASQDLGPLFCPDIENEDRLTIVDEEGWILGVT